MKPHIRKRGWGWAAYKGRTFYLLTMRPSLSELFGYLRARHVA